MIEVSLSDLGPRTRIGVGGQGSVYALAEDPRLVYKEYSTQLVDDVDVTTLNRFVALGSGDQPDTAALLNLAAWPTAVVRKEGVVRGFLMPRVPDRFTVRIKLPGGPDTVLAQVQLLLNSERYLRARGLHIDDRLRLEFLRDTVEALDLLHRLGICVGDLSPNNLLFSLESRPRCYFLDCDAMRLDGDSVLAQAETPEWHVPDATAEELATPASDAYKFGLLAVRLFAGDQQVRDPAAAGGRLDEPLLRLAEKSLTADPLLRAAPAQWFDRLDRAIAGTPPAPEPAPEPEPEVVTGEVWRPRRSVPPRARAAAGPVIVAPASNGRFLGFLMAALMAVGVLIGVLTDDEPAPPASTAPWARPGFSWPAGFPGLGLSTANPGPLFPTNYYPSYPGLGLPRITPTLLDTAPLRACLLTWVSVGPGLDADSPRIEDASRAVRSFLCSLNNGGPEDALDGPSPPGKTQRGRLTKLASGGEISVAEIIGVRAVAGGRDQVNVVFDPSRGSDCWRSRLTLSTGGVSSITAPERYACP